MTERKTFLLIDGHAVIYRAFFAVIGLTNSSGQLVNAVYGFTRIILTAIRDYNPEYIAVTFDSAAPTFRHQDFAAYKANRAEMPEDLRPQIAMVKEMVSALNIPQFAIPGFEADDIIGTISRMLCEKEHLKDENQLLTVIVTGDRDTLQLVDEHTHVWLPARTKVQHNQELDTPAVVLKMGVRPDQIIDLKALMGDASDNIPGVKGIGPKTAVKLITQFESLDGLYEALAKKSAADLDLSPKLVEKLIAEKEMSYLSQKLATIDRHVPITFSLADCKVTNYDKGKVVELLKEWDFKSLINLLPTDEFESTVQAALF